MILPFETKQKSRNKLTNSTRLLKILLSLEEGDVVLMTPLIQGDKKRIVTRRPDERSYVVETPTAVYHCNRVHLQETPEPPPETLWVKSVTAPAPDSKKDLKLSPPRTATRKQTWRRPVLAPRHISIQQITTIRPRKQQHRQQEKIQHHQKIELHPIQSPVPELTTKVRKEG